MNVPKIRFKEFTDDWYCDKLSTYAKKITTKNKNLEVKNVISNSAIYGLISQRDFFDKDIANEINIDSYYIIDNNDFVYNPRKSNEAPYGPINRFSSNEKGVISPLYLCFGISNKINNLYLEKYFKSSKWHRYIYLNGDAGARHDRVSIKDETFFDLNMYLPSTKEQEKIGLFLTLLDKKIELQSKKIEALKLYKLCIMQNIFSKANMKVKLGKIADIFKGKQVNSEELLPNGKYYMLNGGITPSGYLNEYNTLENTITISEGGNSCGYVNFNKVKFWCGGHCYSLNDIKIDNNYLYQALKLNENKLMKLRVGSGLPNIQKKDLENFEFNIHDSAKQNIISNCLNKYDYKIELEIKLLESLMQLKKGLMQSMFV